MANGKEFGQMVDPENTTILDAGDLLRLQPDDRFGWGIEGVVPHCTQCTHTCDSGTSIVE